MGEWWNEPITGTAAGVPFTALPPTVTVQGPAPLVVTWHMLDAPRTDAAFAAALPMTGVPAWRVHLGMPLCGARMIEGGMDAVFELAGTDTVGAYPDSLVRQAAEEFPAALSELRERLPVDNGPIAVVGGSLGGMVVLRILAHPPGLQPAPQLPAAKAVDEAMTWWFLRHLTAHSTTNRVPSALPQTRSQAAVRSTSIAPTASRRCRQDPRWPDLIVR